MEQLINVINNPWFFGSIAGLLALYIVALSVVLAIWTARDIRERVKSPIARFAAPVVVLLFGLAGFVPYLALRPKLTFAEREDERRDLMLLAEAAKKFECPKCFASVEPEFACCPNCSVEFKPVCTCGAAIDQSWKRCAYCGTEVSMVMRSRTYTKPIPAVDLPPAIEPELLPKKVNASKELQKKEKKAKKRLFGRRAKGKLQPLAIPTQPVAVASKVTPKVEVKLPKETAKARISLGGVTGRFRRALAIKR